ncbi:hypothetical protein ACFQGT_00280 [Natrialbaceae archaeon GCM10025810]
MSDLEYGLETADFEAFLDEYYAEYTALLGIRDHTLQIDWEDLYIYDPDVADAALTNESGVLEALSEALESILSDVSVDADEILIQIHNQPVVNGGGA